jgi:ubiquinone/menaquinone biosynthesis C-methylase UbiE
MFSSNTFDLVTSSIVVGYLNNLEKAFSEVYRVLKPQGIFTFSENHPVLVARADGWEEDDKGKKLHWNIDNYFDRNIIVDKWRTRIGSIIETSSLHRTVQDYFDNLVSTGFVVERLVEPEPIEKGKRMNNERYQKAKRIPYFILFKARKL